MKIRNLVLLVMVSFLMACGSAYLEADEHYPEERGFTIDEEAEIADTLEHRQVIDILLQYRNAVVRKDVGSLRRLVSEDYYDNGGTTDTTRDDFGVDQLPDIFELIAQHAEQIKYDVTVKDVAVTDDVAYVDYEYEYAFQYKVGEQTSWDAGLEVNRLELGRRNGEWKIVSGL